MGCGASKSARVLPQDISIVDHPARKSCEDNGNHDRSRTVEFVEEDKEEGDGGGEGRGGREGVVGDYQQLSEETEQRTKEREGKQSNRRVEIDPAYSAQSEIEAAVQEAIPQHSSGEVYASPLPPNGHVDPSSSVPDQQTGVPSSISAPQVFEVCMSSDDRIEARAPVPARLKKLESAPSVTKEMLEMKQYKVKERKKEEIKKRLEKSKMSRRDRLRKEIAAAREMTYDEAGEDVVVLTESFSYSRLQEDKSLGEGGGGEMGDERKQLESKTYTAGTGLVEGDTQYNEEQEEDFWLSSQSEANQPESTTSTDNIQHSDINYSEQFM